MSASQQADPQQSRHIEHAILRALKDLRYGSIEIVIHDSKVVQIERKEKLRLGIEA